MMPGEPKGPLQSLTVNAILGLLLVSILNLFGIHLAPEASVDVDRIITGILGLIAIYGRIRATRRVVIDSASAGPRILGMTFAIVAVGTMLSLTACAPAGPHPASAATAPASLTGKKLMLAADAAYVTAAATADAFADVSIVPAQAKLDAADLLDDAYSMLVLARASYAAGNASGFEERARAVLAMTAQVERILAPSNGAAK